MSDAHKLREAKKAQIMEAARRQAAEVDRDFSDIERLAAKYGLTVEQAAESPAPTVTVVATGKVLHGAARGNPQSVTARSKAESEVVIRELGRPVPLSELFEKITARGVKIGGKKPKWVLSAYLGQSPTLISTPQGWWLKGEPLPGKPAPASNKPAGAVNANGGYDLGHR